MKKILFTTLMLITALVGTTSYAKSDAELDQIVAIVNDDVVTESELNRALSLVKIQMTGQSVNLPSDSVLHQKVLDQLVNKKIQLQVAEQNGVNVSDSDLDEAVARVASQNHLSVSALYQRLNQDGMQTDEYRNEMREQMVLQKLQQQQLISHITITPEEVDAFLHSKSWQNNSANEYHLEDILISLPDAPSPEQIAAAKAKAQRVLAKIHEGQDFNAIAQAESGDNKNALQGGDLGWRKLPEIPSAFSDDVVRMKLKEVAGPIQTANGFHLIRLVAMRSNNKESAAPDRRQIQNLLLQRKFEEAVQNWVSRLRSQAYVVLNPSHKDTQEA